MFRQRFAAVLAVMVSASIWMACRGGAERVDLLAVLESAKKQPDAALFSVADVTLNNQTKRAITVAPAVGTRLTWKVRVPEDGWLSVSLGLKPEAWGQEGDGVVFMVGISDGRSFEGLFTQHVNPFANPTDRRWIDVKADLAAYSGEDVDLIFNTLAGPTGKEPDVRHDDAVWGAPEIVVR